MTRIEKMRQAGRARARRARGKRLEARGRKLVARGKATQARGRAIQAVGRAEQRIASASVAVQDTTARSMGELEARIGHAREVIAPRIEHARETIAPQIEHAVDVTRAKVRQEVLPKISDTLTTTIAATQPAREEARSRGVTAVAALRGQISHADMAKSRKSGRGRTRVVLILAGAGLVGVAAASWKMRQKAAPDQFATQPGVAPDSTSGVPFGSAEQAGSYASSASDATSTPIASARNRAGRGGSGAADW